MDINEFIKNNLIKFIGFLMIILLSNVLIYIILFNSSINYYNKNTPPSEMTDITADSIYLDSDNKYNLDKEIKDNLRHKNIWAMLIDNTDGSVIWSFDLPSTIQTQYTFSDIARLSRYYLQDYPVFVRESTYGLLVLGYPKESIVKFPTNYMYFNMVKNLPILVLIIILFDAFLLFIAYAVSKYKINKAINPIITAIQSLANGNSIELNNEGDLYEINENINKLSLILKKKDTARSNWIAGVSHDIRTPLSMIMGYSDKLANNCNIPTVCKDQAKIIRKNSESIRELVTDLNISSKLEYDNQNLNMKIVHPIKLIRCVIADFLNSGIDESYSIELTTQNIESNTNINGDEFLLKRALNNLIQNSIRHNPNGCKININCTHRANYVFIEVSDNGIGVSYEKLEKVKSNEHYLLGNGNILEQHGLGLLIVKQIVKVHNGKITFKSQLNCGFHVTIILEDITVGEISKYI